MNDSNTRVLDCTLRDGGYYTDWQFAPELVLRYLDVCERSGVDNVELGYLRLRPTGAGPYGDLPDAVPAEVRARLSAAGRLEFSVMVDAAESFGRPAQELATLMRERLGDLIEVVGYVRVAVRFNALGRCAGLLAAIRALGLRPCLNVMQIALADPGQVDQAIQDATELGPLAALYLADSFGSMSSVELEKLLDRFGKVGEPLGFHAHDNRGLALHNTVTALRAGARWLDATMAGMGRGAGNTRTEELLPLLERGDVPARRGLLQFVEEWIAPLHERHRWGASSRYAAAALNRVHPSYVQAMAAYRDLDTAAAFEVIYTLADGDAMNFSAGRLAECVAQARSRGAGVREPQGTAPGRAWPSR
jgi:4-hydroxy 2-oxovalerate aldolase